MKTLIIAEAGVNHNGDINIAKQMIEIAKEAGADIVKFQTFQADAIASAKATRANYQIQNMKEDGSQLSMLKKLELDHSAHKELISYCGKVGIEFLSTAFDLKSLDLLKSLGITLWKIPSGEITNLPYLRKIGSFKEQIILSTGMSNLAEIENAISVLEKSGTERKNITVLHCNTDYPTPFEDVNLNAMNSIKSAFHVNVGYSDHTAGIEVSIAAVALGASLIEKHFTLDKNMSGPDHKASLEPKELKAMISSIRNIEKSMGNGIKVPSQSETKNITIARKSIIASKDISVGELFSEDNLTTKRPGTGISPMNWDLVIGQPAKRNFQADELIEL
ncbi:N-acetylneuraminate synthase [Leptospira limi]|uniref:N-acetylneuraminate synthase n=1 Tax=Leptospira limi TaxID=2950023 RepID=A0ABT3LZ19_9LEPT|nr:N-acetylneuraminate synthase [Leptospira limi]MCW7462976.1 N-acetylneuraminate synthase [Leptospira limi]